MKPKEEWAAILGESIWDNQNGNERRKRLEEAVVLIQKDALRPVKLKSNMVECPMCDGLKVETLTGGTVSFPRQTTTVKCHCCLGEGKILKDKSCYACNGKGHDFVNSTKIICVVCEGTGKIAKEVTKGNKV